MPESTSRNALSNNPYEIAEDIMENFFDRRQMQTLLQNFCDAVEIGAAIIDRNGKVFIGARWQRICTEFHRAHPDTLGKCIESESILAANIKAGQSYSIHTCPLGLTDAASPIIIGGRHIGKVFVGQFLLHPPDMDYFCTQADKYSFDVPDYLLALLDVPIVCEKKLWSILGFLKGFAELAAEIGTEHAAVAGCHYEPEN